MLRLVRLLAAMALLTAAAVTAADLIQHAQSGGPVLRSTFAWWLMAGPSSMAAFQTFLEQAFGAAMWDPVMLAILGIPAALVLVLKAIFLLSMATAVRSS